MVTTHKHTENKHELIKFGKLSYRYNYSKLDFKNFVAPNLLDIQKDYEKKILNSFAEIFEHFFPIEHDKKNKFRILFNKVNICKQKNYLNEIEAKKQLKSYEKAIYVDLVLENKETGECVDETKKDKNSNGYFLTNIPILTSNGKFIINGVEKNVVAQIIRSPGVFVLNNPRNNLIEKENKFNSRIVEVFPNNNISLLQFFISRFDNNVKPIVKVAIRCNYNIETPSQKKIIVNVIDLLYAFGLTPENILSIFENNEIIKNTIDECNSNVKDCLIVSQNHITTKGFRAKYLKNIEGQNQELDLLFSDYEKKNIDEETFKKLVSFELTAKNFCESLSIPYEKYSNVKSYQHLLYSYFMNKGNFNISSAGRYIINNKLSLVENLLNKTIAEDILSKNDKVIFKSGTFIDKKKWLDIKETAEEGNIKFKSISMNKYLKSNIKSSAFLKNILTNIDTIKILNSNNNVSTLFAPEYIDEEEKQAQTLNIADFISFIALCINANNQLYNVDDVDHLSNKRLRLLNEQLYQYFLFPAFAKSIKTIKDKLASLQVPTAHGETADKIEQKTKIANIFSNINIKNAIKSFFNTNQLTEFLEQQNPLSELASKRKISARGKGGISQEDPNLDLRDINYTQYGRICPIASPEGQSVGLIMSLSLFSKVDKNGFITTPYRKVKDGKIDFSENGIVYLTSIIEDKYIIADALIPHDNTGKITVDKYICRNNQEQYYFSSNEIDFVDISPQQVLSVSPNLIPFVESDEGHRAEMASNMQRQALPLLKPYAPTIGTGLEYHVAIDSLSCLKTNNSGTVKYVDSSKIVVDDTTYHLTKFDKSNQNTCINQTPIVSVGDKVSENDIIADGYAMNNNELAIGQNILVAFTAWNGYNFEDAIVVSERLVKNDLLTSIVITTVDFEVFNTKLGDEEVTRDIAGVSDNAKKYLNTDGVINVGTYVNPGDILIGKNAPNAESELSGEALLLNSIFSSSQNYKKFHNKSLIVPHGVSGVVCAVQKLSIETGHNFENAEVIAKYVVYIATKRKIEVGDKLAGRHGNKGVVSIVVPEEDMPHLEDGTPIDICLNPQGVPSRLNIGQIFETNMGLACRLKALNTLIESSHSTNATEISKCYGLSLEKAKILVKNAKKYYDENDWKTIESIKKNISANDFDIILSNSGLTIEDLNIKIYSPSFCGANYNDVKEILEENGVDVDKTHAKYNLIDGKTGEKFDNPVTVGVQYLMKLNHMVEDKIHARSIGSYNKITQQPLGGKSQNGGQRLGEMEVWALEAYGAAYNIQELMTIKSDDVFGRKYTYNNIINGEMEKISCNIPDAFKLLTKHINALGMKLDVVTEDGQLVDFNEFSKFDKGNKNKNTQNNIKPVKSYESSNYNDEDYASGFNINFNDGDGE